MSYNTARREVIRKVFPGRGGLNRALILEGLLVGAKTPADLARYIIKNTKKDHNYTHVERKYKHVYSSIDRKKGALDWLSKHEFIEKKLDGYDLTGKGQSVALVLTENFETVIPLIKQDFLLHQGELRESMKDIENIPLFKGLLPENGFGTMVDVLGRNEFWEVFRSKTGSLIDKGLNIVDLSEHELSSILMPQVLTELARRKIIKVFNNRRR